MNTAQMKSQSSTHPHTSLNFRAKHVKVKNAPLYYYSMCSYRFFIKKLFYRKKTAFGLKAQTSVSVSVLNVWLITQDSLP